MNYAEIEKIAEEEWMAANSWGLPYMDFVRLCSKKNEFGENKNGGDTVYMSSKGNELTRAMAAHWADQWHPFLHGFQLAIKYMEEHS